MDSLKISKHVKNSLEGLAPNAWRIIHKRYCGDFTKDPDIAEYWKNREGGEVIPLYTAEQLIDALSLKNKVKE